MRNGFHFTGVQLESGLNEIFAVARGRRVRQIGALRQAAVDLRKNLAHHVVGRLCWRRSVNRRCSRVVQQHRLCGGGAGFDAEITGPHTASMIAGERRRAVLWVNASYSSLPEKSGGRKTDTLSSACRSCVRASSASKDTGSPSPSSRACRDEHHRVRRVHDVLIVILSVLMTCL